MEPSCSERDLCCMKHSDHEFNLSTLLHPNSLWCCYHLMLFSNELCLFTTQMHSHHEDMFNASWGLEHHHIDKGSASAWCQWHLIVSYQQTVHLFVYTHTHNCGALVSELVFVYDVYCKPLQSGCTICVNSRHDATLLFTGTCGCSLPIDSTGGVSAHAQCKQTATAKINEFTGWAIIILQHHMNKIGAHQTMVPWYHGTAHPTEADQLCTQRGYINRSNTMV